MVDYSRIYDRYWALPDRYGESSFSDPTLVANEIVGLCEPRRVLDVGCGMGLLVRALLKEGIDAVGLDVSPRAVRFSERCTPGRSVVGNILSLPIPDGTFDTVVSTDCMEHLEERDIPAALSELHRISSRFLYLRLSTMADRDGQWHLTVKPREWWESRLFEAGFRRHPLFLSAAPYESMERENYQIVVAAEKVPPAALRRYPLPSLAPMRDLHMDMLRETGRRSDAHVMRYSLAAEFVRPGDVVLDVACGLGYGSSLLASTTRASEVVGMDADPFAIEYAEHNYGRENVRFVSGAADSLESIEDDFADCICSVETLEHLRDPEEFLDHAQRVLRPGGRIFVSVPNDWTDETGTDPNPHHHHVYTWERIRSQLGRRFLLERCWIQTAGGGLRLREQPRRLRETSTESPPTEDSEWILMLGMKDPTKYSEVPYSERAFPTYPDNPDSNITAFGRDYINPWIVRGLVSIGLRNVNPMRLEECAWFVLGNYPKESPDAGAALCVLGYRLLEDPMAPADKVRDLLRRIDAYLTFPQVSPHGLRWATSLLYVKARLLMSLGEHAAAHRVFMECGHQDVDRFSPLLATKVVDALFNAGWLDWNSGRFEQAVDAWKEGMERGRAAVSGSWTNVWGSLENPVTFSLPEAADILEKAAKCAFGVHHALNFRDRPGLLHRILEELPSNRLSLQRRELQDARAWIESLNQSVAWWGDQARALEAELARLNQSVTWWGSQARALEAELAKHHGVIADLESWANTLIQGRAWLEGQIEAFGRQVAERDAALVESQEWVRLLTEGKVWLEGQVEGLRQQVTEQGAAWQESQEWARILTEGKTWLEGQVAALRRALAERDSVVGDLEGQVEGLRQQVTERDAALAESGEIIRAQVVWIESARRSRLFGVLFRLGLLDRPPTDRTG